MLIYKYHFRGGKYFGILFPAVYEVGSEFMLNLWDVWTHCGDVNNYSFVLNFEVNSFDKDVEVIGGRHAKLGGSLD